MSTVLDDILGRLGALPEADRAHILAAARAEHGSRPWTPNPGPQTEAFFCEADELFYGGQAGGGKSDLLLGLALTAHRRSLILRRTNKEADKLVERLAEILGSRQGWNGQEDVWRLPGGRVIDIGGCQLEDDKQKRKGIPHDLKGFDEIADFTESQYAFIIGWNRSADPAQRCRVVATGNPPTRPEGLWVVRRWAAWLDPRHPNPAQPGELRWYTTIDGRDTEVDGPGPHVIPGERDPVLARSRTFIRARLADNPDLARTGYDATLAALPEEYRAAYREGRFDAALRDDPYQAIPTAWVVAAQHRWTPRPPPGVPMCALGVDVAQGGTDETVLAPRHDGWYAPLIATPGSKTPYGRDVAGLIVAHRRDAATVVIDLGGGYGGAAYEHLKSNDPEFPVAGFKGAARSTRRTRDRKLGFRNKRSEAVWLFREALDPSQPGGSPIALPQDPGLIADLTAPTFAIGPHGIEVEAKEAVCARLGRSTDRGDAVTMAWSDGARGLVFAADMRPDQRALRSLGGGGRPKVVLGHEEQRRRL
jgi:hypothetical protein